MYIIILNFKMLIIFDGNNILFIYYPNYPNLNFYFEVWIFYRIITSINKNKWIMSYKL